MQFKNIIVVIALIMGLTASPATAATFNISFSQMGIGDDGPDWYGSFVAPVGGGPVSSFTALIGRTNYNVIDPSFFPPSYGARSNVIGDGLVTNGPLAAGSLVLALLGTSTFEIGICRSANLCSTRSAGTYSISAVPLPAALPLLGLGIAALGALGWARKCVAKI